MFFNYFLFLFSRPENFQSNFLIPSKQSTEAEDNNNCSVLLDDVVRILISYDMGWSRRETGRDYDSLNGFGTIVGAMSGLVLDHGICNRKCKKWGSNDGNPNNHDCRKNYLGSAKGMESHVAKKLIVESKVLKAQNLEVGVFIQDDDSSSIAQCRAASSHPKIKESDTNAKGVEKQLHNIQKSHKELTKDAIT